MELDELKRLDREATPGPWAYDSRSGGENNESEWGRTGFWLGNRCFWGTAESWGGDWEDPNEANAALIAAARNALPALIECAEVLEDILQIVDESRGVAGFHLNGDTAEWDEFEGVDAARAALAALKEAGNG